MSPFTVVQDCGCLLNITNGRVELNPNTLPGSVATYSCNQGHTRIGELLGPVRVGHGVVLSQLAVRQSCICICLWWALRNKYCSSGTAAHYCGQLFLLSFLLACLFILTKCSLSNYGFIDASFFYI